MVSEPVPGPKSVGPEMIAAEADVGGSGWRFGGVEGVPLAAWPSMVMTPTPPYSPM